MMKKTILAVVLASLSPLAFAVADSSSSSNISVKPPRYVIVDAGAIIKLDTETGESWVLIKSTDLDVIQWARIRDDGKYPWIRDLVIPKQASQKPVNPLRY
jgi:hypothetical protein